MTCTCNCCKYTDEYGNKVDGKSCVQKKALGNFEPNEVCDCQCPDLRGPQGSIGHRGQPGTDGVPGKPGQPGEPGVDGLHGKPGSSGSHGGHGVDIPDCVDGLNGKQGLKGVVGLSGKQGARGLDGSSGSQGSPGLRGLPGPQGDAGKPGSDGLPGEPGLVGQPGPRGKPGSMGEQGEVGSDGPAGSPGMRGYSGHRGPPGLKGLPGKPGDNGHKGLPGQAGPRGIYGEPGTKGEPGVNGKDSELVGQPGAPGDNGPRGTAGGLSAEFDWRYIEALVAEQLYSVLSYPSEYCDVPEQVCACENTFTDSAMTDLTIQSTDGAENDHDPNLVPETPKTHNSNILNPKLDMVILIDGSDSIEINQWEPLKNFVSDFITTFDHSHIQKYSETSTLVVVQYSNNDNYWVKKRLFNELFKVENDFKFMVQMAKGTDTFAALEFVLQDVASYKLRLKTINSDLNQEKALILITNGLSDDRFDMKNRLLTNDQVYNQIASTFKIRSVVGIGSEIGSDHSDLDGLVGSENDLILVDEIGELDSKVIDRLVGKFG
jgi:hypothetical protein